MDQRIDGRGDPARRHPAGDPVEAEPRVGDQEQGRHDVEPIGRHRPGIGEDGEQPAWRGKGPHGRQPDCDQDEKEGHTASGGPPGRHHDEAPSQTPRVIAMARVAVAAESEVRTPTAAMNAATITVPITDSA